MTRPRAVGYLRRDISGVRKDWDENQVRSLAAKFGYDLCKIFVFGSNTDQPLHRLRIAVERTHADAVVVPSVDHFAGGQIPTELQAVATIITVSPEQSLPRSTARWELKP
ncbi:hypothetical protein HLB23_33935 [Nocardia uniformis]|uniref:Recombinase family protein n=2 Tax=Nocardia uniformis TaxID=53432 RepID=A0A849CE47_9NOCA|nr:hypothetical protein [Nocardia uniformis]